MTRRMTECSSSEALCIYYDNSLRIDRRQVIADTPPCDQNLRDPQTN